MSAASPSKPKPYTLLTVVRSESGSWNYEIRTSHQDGKTYCTCRGFTFHKRCKHMDAYLRNPTIAPSSATVAKPSTAKSIHAVLREELTIAFGPLRTIGSLTDNELRLVGLRVQAFVLSEYVPSKTLAPSPSTFNEGGVRVITLPD